MRSVSSREWLILALSAVEGIVLGWGVESCFGIGRYKLIMVLGVLGGVGGVVVGRLVLARWDKAAGSREKLHAILWGVVPAVITLAAWFLARVLPLIREEIKFSS